MKSNASELVRRYKKNYNIPDIVNITEEMILTHWELEKELTLELLHSKAENRWETFERCYTRLYSELSWLNRIEEQDKEPPHQRFEDWIRGIGSPPKSIYEIGSGKGELISYLAQNGYCCKGTEITRTRGEMRVQELSPNLSWGVSDGVHLDKFEPAETYDVVISSQVIEHFHPEDLEDHLRGVHSILKAGGKYILSTPHKYTGPHDVSRVFKLDKPQGMHLREYTYRELIEALNKTGFAPIYYAAAPKNMNQIMDFIGVNNLIKSSNIGANYLDFLLFFEKKLKYLPSLKFRRILIKILKKLYLFSDNIYLISEKTQLESKSQSLQGSVG